MPARLVILDNSLDITFLEDLSPSYALATETISGTFLASISCNIVVQPVIAQGLDFVYF